MDQTELDQAGVKAKEEALEAAKDKDRLAGHIDATQHAVEVAEEELKQQKADLKVQDVDNSKPHVGGDPDLNTAPAAGKSTGATAVAESKRAAAAEDKK